MGYTQPGQYLSKLFKDLRATRKSTSQWHKKQRGKISKERLGVLQARFAIVRGPARMWHKEDLWYIMQACVILHNMIIEDERDEKDDFNYHQEGILMLQPVDYQRRNPLVLEDFLKIHDEIEDRSLHERLRDDLVEHLWAIHSSR
jgi:hypothetical protein